jgi:hypothetical protein
MLLDAALDTARGRPPGQDDNVQYAVLDAAHGRAPGQDDMQLDAAY